MILVVSLATITILILLAGLWTWLAGVHFPARGLWQRRLRGIAAFALALLLLAAPRLIDWLGNHPGPDRVHSVVRRNLVP